MFPRGVTNPSFGLVYSSGPQAIPPAARRQQPIPKVSKLGTPCPSAQPHYIHNGHALPLCPATLHTQWARPTPLPCPSARPHYIHNAPLTTATLKVWFLILNSATPHIPLAFCPMFALKRKCACIVWISQSEFLIYISVSHLYLSCIQSDFWFV